MKKKNYIVILRAHVKAQKRVVRDSYHFLILGLLSLKHFFVRTIHSFH